MLAVIFVIYFLIGSGVWIVYEASIRSVVNPDATPWKYVIFWPLLGKDVFAVFEIYFAEEVL